MRIADLAETGRQDQHHLDALLPTGLHDSRNGYGWCGHNGQINCFSDLIQGLVGFYTLNGIVLRINCENFALVVRRKQVFEYHSANRIFPVTGPEQGHFAWGEKRC